MVTIEYSMPSRSARLKVPVISSPIASSLSGAPQTALLHCTVIQSTRLDAPYASHFVRDLTTLVRGAREWALFAVLLRGEDNREA